MQKHLKNLRMPIKECLYKDTLQDIKAEVLPIPAWRDLLVFLGINKMSLSTEERRIDGFASISLTRLGIF